MKPLLFATVLIFGSITLAQSPNQSSFASISGCLSAEPAADGNFILNNRDYAGGVELVKAPDVAKHAGHRVQVSGTWQTSKTGRKLKVSSFRHIADTCDAEEQAGSSEGAKIGADANAGSTGGSTVPKK